MATPQVPGFDAGGFDAQAFRDAIQFSMQMGAAPEGADQATFIFRSVGPATYWKNGVEVTPAPRLDQDGKPLDPDIEVRQPAPVEMKVDCAVEFFQASPDELPTGNFLPTKAVLTLLDQDYAKVKGCLDVRLGGDRYRLGYEVPPMGLFDVGIHQLVFFALDES